MYVEDGGRARGLGAVTTFDCGGRGNEGVGVGVVVDAW